MTAQRNLLDKYFSDRKSDPVAIAMSRLWAVNRAKCAGDDDVLAAKLVNDQSPATVVQPGRGQAKSKLTCDAAMRKALELHPEAVFWSVRQWASYFAGRHKRSAIHATTTWRKCSDHRSNAHAERRLADAKRQSDR